jgi:hypothetical protein|tara:strand:- start:359 stop:574 length:216 start_codon:yes stop_codon:yes gene_type:complete
MENIFEIKNNFIPPKDQELISPKFDTNLDRSGRSMLGTIDSMVKPIAPINPQEPMDVPVPVPGIEFDQKEY